MRRLMASLFLGLTLVGGAAGSALAAQPVKTQIWLDGALVRTILPPASTPGEGTDPFFMVPGTAHCGDGPGAWDFDPLPALEHWVEAGTAPDVLAGTNPNTGLSRPICAYPRVARLKASSLDPGLASSFACVDLDESQDR